MTLRQVLEGSREALLVMRQIEEALRHGFSVEPGSFLHDEVTRLCSGGTNQQREAKKLAAMSPEDRTPACDKHLSRNEEHECPWCKLDEERQYSERMLAAYQEAHRQAMENGAAYHALASKLDRCEELLATAYQLAGLVGAPVRFLDAYALHDGTDADSLLPVGLDELEEFKALASRLGAVEDELRHSVSVMSIVRSWLLENVRGSTHWENCEREHATCRAISQLGGVVERLSRLNLTAAGRESLQNVPQIGPGRIPQT